jgi:hypothetical protein
VLMERNKAGAMEEIYSSDNHREEAPSNEERFGE